jgi:hypothetical protein
MNSETVSEFWRLYYALPIEVRQEAREAYRMWVQNPSYPGLRFKNLFGPLYSIRIGNGYRAVGKETSKDVIVWFWIGSHEAANNLIKQLRKRMKG